MQHANHPRLRTSVLVFGKNGTLASSCPRRQLRALATPTRRGPNRTVRHDLATGQNSIVASTRPRTCRSADTPRLAGRSDSPRLAPPRPDLPRGPLGEPHLESTAAELSTPVSTAFRRRFPHAGRTIQTRRDTFGRNSPLEREQLHRKGPNGRHQQSPNMNNSRDTEISMTVIVIVLSVEQRAPTVPAWQQRVIRLGRAAVIALLAIF